MMALRADSCCRRNRELARIEKLSQSVSQGTSVEGCMYLPRHCESGHEIKQHIPPSIAMWVDDRANDSAAHNPSG